MVGNGAGKNIIGFWRRGSLFDLTDSKPKLQGQERKPRWKFKKLFIQKCINKAKITGNVKVICCPLPSPKEK